MNPEFIKTADMIIKYKGRCSDILNLNCIICPAYNFKNGSCDVSHLCTFDTIEWFRNWKKENEVEEMEKIQMTEEQFERCYAFFMNISWNDNYNNTLKMAKEKGLIKKSSLRQKVEEAEELYATFMDNKCHENVLIVKLRETICLLKKDHPEFKK